MLELQRITTEYIETEDRIRVSGDVGSDQTVVLWLTQRLLDRLLPVLLGWLEQQTGSDFRGSLLQSFAQQAAMAMQEPQMPVHGQPSSYTWLVHSVDIAVADQGMGLMFKGGDGEGREPVSLALQALPLRQWLNILHDQYAIAGWPLTVWPGWVVEAPHASADRQIRRLH